MSQIYHSTLIAPIYEKVKSMILNNELKARSENNPGKNSQ